MTRDDQKIINIRERWRRRLFSLFRVGETGVRRGDLLHLGLHPALGQRSLNGSLNLIKDDILQAAFALFRIGAM